MSENWRPVPGFEGRYEVSDLGRVRRICAAKTGRNARAALPFMLTANRNSRGYLCVTFLDGKTRTVHSLVAAAFIGARPDGFDISHKNLDKTCNIVSNLEYLSRSAHLEYSFAHGERPPFQKPGERNSNAKLTTAQVAEIRKQIAAKRPQRLIAQEMGVHQATVSRIARNHCWATV